MPSFERDVHIDAPADRVWQVLADVEQWPTWTTSMEKVRLRGAPPAGPGAIVDIKQPKLAASTWRITDWQPGAGFAWTSGTLGMRSTAYHTIESCAEGCVVRLRLTIDGWMAGIATHLFGRLIGKYMEAEANGLRARCEQAAVV